MDLNSRVLVPLTLFTLGNAIECIVDLRIVSALNSKRRTMSNDKRCTPAKNLLCSVPPRCELSIDSPCNFVFRAVYLLLPNTTLYAQLFLEIFHDSKDLPLLPRLFSRRIARDRSIMAMWIYVL